MSFQVCKVACEVSINVQTESGYIYLSIPFSEKGTLSLCTEEPGKKPNAHTNKTTTISNTKPARWEAVAALLFRGVMKIVGLSRSKRGLGVVGVFVR